jgi:quercetin dioxygenase-like cupin family protein
MVNDMSYPEPVYHGDAGLLNATFRSGSQAPDLTYRTGGTAHYLSTGASSGGKLGVYRWEMAPEPSGPAPHFHKAIAEAFYVLYGTVRLFDGNQWLDGRQGDYLYVPEGGIHAFRNESGAPASMLLLFAPGAPREDYFETLARVAEGLVMTDEERAAFFIRHDTYWV